MAVNHRCVDELEALEACLAGHRVQACGGKGPVDEVISVSAAVRCASVGGITPYEAHQR
jgi:hypothetical protein